MLHVQRLTINKFNNILSVTQNSKLIKQVLQFRFSLTEFIRVHYQKAEERQCI